MNDLTSIDFDGVFKFTNATDEDFTALWNNKEYFFPKQKTVPLIISGESLENIQEIRKRFAYRLAEREFYAGKVYKGMVKMGEKTKGGIPPTYDEKLLEPVIDSCLKPLPVEKLKVKEGKKINLKFKGSKAVNGSDNLNETFKDEPIIAQGQMPNSHLR